MPMPDHAHEGIVGVSFPSDGFRLLGVLYLARGAGPHPTALLPHGCPGLEQNGDLAADLRDRGWNALIFHYRGSWGSQGRYNLATVPRDVLAAADYLQSGAHPSVDPGRLVVIGHSLGGWAAILAAAADQRLRAVAACGAAVTLGGLDLPLPEIDRELTRFLAITPLEFARQRDEVTGRLEPLAAIGSIAPRPLLIVHGTGDEWIAAGQARLLAARAGPGCRYQEIEGANHTFAWHRPALRELIGGWLAELDI